MELISADVATGDSEIPADEKVDGVDRGAAFDSRELGALLALHRDRLVRMVQLRIDPRIKSRLDASDIVQESLFDAAKRYPQYVKQPKLPFHHWIRTVVEHRLLHLHREHLGVQARDARREVPLDHQGDGYAELNSFTSALADSGTSPSMTAARMEAEEKLHAELSRLDPIDREILHLRHFKQLSNVQTAQALGISESAATKRHIRALLRLRQALGDRVEGADRDDYRAPQIDRPEIERVLDR